MLSNTIREISVNIKKDLLLGGDKLLGSAQRRIKNAVLQHGSLILGRHFEQQPSAELAAALKVPIDLQVLIAAVTAQLGEQLRLVPQRAVLTAGEKERLGDLREKYAGQVWNRQR